MSFNNPIKAAKSFALMLDVDKPRKSIGLPFSQHIEKTVSVLMEFGYKEPDLIVATYLNETIGIHDVSESTLSNLFNKNVAEYVSALTRPGVPGLRGSIRNLPIPQKIKTCPKAAAILIADRIAMAEAALDAPSARMQNHLHATYTEFKHLVHDVNKHPKLWSRLNSLQSRIFLIVDPIMFEANRRRAETNKEKEIKEKEEDIFMI